MKILLPLLMFLPLSLMQLPRRVTLATDVTPVGSEWIELFNGRDLAGWVNVNGAPKSWQVRDGSIVCTGHPRSFLRTKAMYENFVLELEWRHVAAGGNSGVFVHADALPQVGAPFPRSIEAQLLDGDHGSLFGIRGASIVPITNPDKKGRTARARPLEQRCRPAGQWNQYTLTSRSGALELAVNGKPVTRAEEASQVQGYICLQAEHSEVHFRKLRLRRLPTSSPPVERIAQADAGFVSLFDGQSFQGWKHLPGHKGHWVATDGAIEYDGRAEEPNRVDNDLWTTESFADFELIVDWRLPSKPQTKPHPVVLPNGDFVYLEGRKRKTVPKLDAGDSGIYLRGSSKAQLNIWSQSLGSGEINGYRTDRGMPAEIRQACIPKKKADNPFGQWNRFLVSVRGDQVSVLLNGERVIDHARLPGIPASGPVALQHHGDPTEFRNLFIKELP